MNLSDLNIGVTDVKSPTGERRYASPADPRGVLRSFLSFPLHPPCFPSPPLPSPQ